MNMLRNIKLYFSALALLLGATSCLEKYPESAFQEKDAMRTFADAEQTLTGFTPRSRAAISSAAASP